MIVFNQLLELKENHLALPHVKTMELTIPTMETKNVTMVQLLELMDVLIALKNLDGLVQKQLQEFNLFVLRLAVTM